MTLDFARSALLEIDVQHDFCPAYTGDSGEKRPAGALAVEGGDAVVPVLNGAARCFAAAGGRVIATQDWHPPGHVSFASSRIDRPEVPDRVLWPDHCVQGSAGAAFHEKLDLRPVNLVLRKGFRQNLDSYSAFFENDRKTPTGLGAFLSGLSIRTVVIGGLATDYCVLYSALDAARLGLETLVLLDAVRGVGFPEGSVERALKSMKDAGVVLLESGTLK